MNETERFALDQAREQFPTEVVISAGQVWREREDPHARYVVVGVTNQELSWKYQHVVFHPEDRPSVLMSSTDIQSFRNCMEMVQRQATLDDRVPTERAVNAYVGDVALRQRSKEFEDVRAFHQKFGLLCFDTPGQLTERKLQERIEFMLEELGEFAQAAGFEIVNDIRYGDACNDLAKQADALVDLVYVALGTAVQLGLPWDWLWDDVQRANMEKVRGVTKRGHAVDVTKPPGWKPPQPERILEIAGYKGDAQQRRDDATEGGAP